MNSILTICLAGLLFACQSGKADPEPMASLLESQSSGYGVPAGAGDVAFQTSAAMGAVQWSALTERQLADWYQIWSLALGRPDGPSHTYSDSEGTVVDLFALSPKDGFCVAFAQHMDGGLHDPCVSGFMKSL